MEDIFKKIIDADERAKEVVNKAKMENDKASGTVTIKKEELRSEYTKSTQKELEKLEEMFSKDEEHKMADFLQKVADAEQRLDSSRDKNINKWADSIASDVIYSLSGGLRGAKE